MILEDFHVHSDFSDGADSPERVAEAALALGMTRLGFADHGWAEYDSDCCIPRARLARQRETVRELAARLRGRLEVYCGVEQDLWSDAPTADYDYVIGSVHYLRSEGRYYPVDASPEELLAAAEERFGGNLLALAEAYYAAVGTVRRRTGCDIVGHFDLIQKFNEGDRLFDSAHPRYRAAWQGAAERLLADGARVFEINTGAMSRGWRSAAYPAPEIQRYLARRGAVFVLSSDSHSAGTLCHDFPNQERLAAERGIPLVSFRVNRKS